MSNAAKLFIIILTIGFLGLGFSVFAQDVTEEVDLDENIQAEDLEVEDPRILPDSPFYFLKNWGRGIRSLFAFSPLAKSELRSRFANEKLIEIKKMVEKKKGFEAIKKATDSYQKEIEKIRSEAAKIKEKARENPKVEKFLDKFIHQQILHQKLLQRLENQVPEQAFEKIKETRERHLEKFQEVMLRLEDRKEKITEKLNDVLEKQKGSRFKHFKNLEILLELEEKVPENAKEAIRKAQENSLTRLKDNLENMSPEDQDKFKEYLEKISGEKEKHLEIIENLRLEAKEIPSELRKTLEDERIRILKELKETLEKSSRFPLCPRLVWIDPGSCTAGRIIIERDSRGCPLAPKCVITASPPPSLPPEGQVCIALFDPVCGKDEKTYSNECFAKIARVEVDYKGVCREYEYYIHGTFTREASDENIKDLLRIAERFQAGAGIMESFPMQFQVYPLINENCPEVRRILGTREYITHFSDCRSRPTQPSPGLRE
ncbi:hypothetical protein IH779_03320 [Patescibacteria group bacterium]|nr:hypothetical protein [Patescibacteria group bacterium]